MKFEIYAEKAKIKKGSLFTCELQMNSYFDRRKRIIRVWLPEGYNGVKKFPVLYMHDGQNLFAGLDERYKWNVDQGMTSLSEEDQAIIVAIDTCMETRFSELCPPYPINEEFFHHLPAVCRKSEMPTGDKYAEFIVYQVKPLIDEQFAVLNDAEHTGIGGSSMGGLESFYMAMKYPDIFGRCLSFSPAFYSHELSFELDALMNYDYSRIRNSRFFLYNGYETLDSVFTEAVWAFFKMMREKGMDYRHVALVEDTRQPHFEPAWEKYFPEAVQYLFQADNSVIMPNSENDQNNRNKMEG